MIVNWKKKNAGVLVLPCLENGKRTKVIHILPGHNDVPDADWKIARNSALRHIRSGNIVEIIKEKPVKVSAEKPVQPAKTERTGDLLDPANFPYNDVVKILKELGMFEEITGFKKKETNKKNLNKDWLITYMKEEEADWDKVKAALVGPSTEEENSEDDSTIDEEDEVTSAKLSELESVEAEEIINDTWNLETLEKWKKEVSQPDLRVLIMNQMEEVQKPANQQGAGN
ncbi:hypothetical protein KA005_21630 [bacterium]|nr:hypothetical protein [bacterium]